MFCRSIAFSQFSAKHLRATGLKVMAPNYYLKKAPEKIGF